MRDTATEEYHVAPIRFKTSGIRAVPPKLPPGDRRWLLNDKGEPAEAVCRQKACGFVGLEKRQLQRYAEKGSVLVVTDPLKLRRLYDVKSLICFWESRRLYRSGLRERAPWVEDLRKVFCCGDSFDVADFFCRVIEEGGSVDVLIRDWCRKPDVRWEITKRLTRLIKSRRTARPEVGSVSVDAGPLDGIRAAIANRLQKLIEARQHAPAELESCSF